MATGRVVAQSRHFIVFVAGASRRSHRAVRALHELLEAAGLTGTRVDVVDVLDDPASAERHRVLALPMVLRVFPEPAVRLVGDLSDRGAAADLLGLAEDRVVTVQEPEGDAT